MMSTGYRAERYGVSVVVAYSVSSSPVRLDLRAVPHDSLRLALLGVVELALSSRSAAHRPEQLVLFRTPGNNEPLLPAEATACAIAARRLARSECNSR